MLTKTGVQRAVRSLGLLKFYPSNNPDANRVIVGMIRELFDSDAQLERAIAEFLREASEWTGSGAFFAALRQNRSIRPATNDCPECKGSSWQHFVRITDRQGDLVADGMSEEEWSLGYSTPGVWQGHHFHWTSRPCRNCEGGRAIAAHLEADRLRKAA